MKEKIVITVKYIRIQTLLYTVVFGVFATLIFIKANGELRTLIFISTGTMVLMWLYYKMNAFIKKLEGMTRPQDN